MNFKKPILIAEVGCNHKGELKTAMEFIKIAKEFCNVPCIKFQKRDPKTLLSEEEYNLPHPVEQNSYGKTYGEHREFLEFDIEKHKILKKECEDLGIEYFSSVWDIKSTKEICDINPKKIKIGSATNLNFEVLDYICKNFKGEIHLSLGMTTTNEEEKIVNFFKKHKRNNDLILYACTSAYPVETDDVCLLEIKRLIEKYKTTDQVKDIGFSGHHKGISFDIAAYTLGANYIERHFTLDRTWKGTDHAASLEPDGLRRLNRNLKSLNLALKFKNKEILDIELQTRSKLKKEIS